MVNRHLLSTEGLTRTGGKYKGELALLELKQPFFPPSNIGPPALWALGSNHSKHHQCPCSQAFESGMELLPQFCQASRDNRSGKLLVSTVTCANTSCYAMTCSMDLRMAPWAYFSGEPCYRNEKLDNVFIHSCCCNNTRGRIHSNRQNYVPGTLIGSLLPRCQHLTRFFWLHHDMVRGK